MVVSKSGVTARLRQKVIIFFISFHCVVCRTSLAALNIVKAHAWREMSKYVDDIVNDVAYIKKSSNCKVVLHFFKNQLNDAQKSMRRY
jgi:hypothetical protein